MPEKWIVEKAIGVQRCSSATHRITVSVEINKVTLLHEKWIDSIYDLKENVSTTVKTIAYRDNFNDDLVYYTLPKNPQLLLNILICSYFHITNLMCGDCEEGHSPFEPLYNLNCVKCPHGHQNWWKFILVAFVPLTLFSFFVPVFNVNVTSLYIHGVVWFRSTLVILT